MTKSRFYVWILSMIYSLGLIPVMIFFSEYFYPYFFCGMLLMYLSFHFRKTEKQKLFLITLIYINDCDPKRYLQELDRYNEKVIKTKNFNLMNKISRALIYLDCGDSEKCYELLYSLVDKEPKLSPFIKFWYYKAWIYYYEAIDEGERMRVLIDQIKEIAENSPDRYRIQLQANFKQIQSRYFVKTGIYLDNAYENYSEVLKGRFPKLTVLVGLYYLGLIAYKQGKWDLARERFSSVVNSIGKLHIQEKAQKYLNILENKTNA